MFDIILKQKNITKEIAIDLIQKHSKNEGKVLPSSTVAYLCGYKLSRVSLSLEEVDVVLKKINTLSQKNKLEEVLLLSKNECSKINKGIAYLETKTLSAEAMSLHRKTKKKLKKNKNADSSGLLTVNVNLLEKHEFAREFPNFVPEVFILSVIDGIVNNLVESIEQVKEAEKMKKLILCIQSKLDSVKALLKEDSVDGIILLEAYSDLFAHLLKLETVYKFQMIKHGVDSKIKEKYDNIFKRMNLSGNLFSIFLEDALTLSCGTKSPQIPVDLTELQEIFIDKFACSMIQAAKCMGENCDFLDGSDE
jgi:antitoxin component of RelBE/YafQ-DinJ toxin-antitoxin module